MGVFALICKNCLESDERKVGNVLIKFEQASLKKYCKYVSLQKKSKVSSKIFREIGLYKDTYASVKKRLKNLDILLKN